MVLYVICIGQPPYNDCTAAAGFVGIKPSTTKAHMVRAVLESIAFRTAQLYECVRAETSYNFHSIRYRGISFNTLPVDVR